MKSFALSLLLAVSANGIAIPDIEPRQSAAELGAAFIPSLITNGLINFLPKKKAFKIEEIPAKTAGAKRLRFVYGPYTLGAANATKKLGNGYSMDKGGTAYLNMVDDDFPSDITVVETQSSISDEKNTRVPTSAGIYNHHNIFFETTKVLPSAFQCEGGKKTTGVPISVLIGGATEVGTVDFGSKSKISAVKTGYYLKKDRKVVTMLDVVNYNNEERTIYTTSEMEFIPGKPDGYLDTVQAIIEPGLCGGQNGLALHAPVGVSKFSVNSTGITVGQNGYLTNLRGHMHDGGIRVKLLINGQEACDSKAVYGGDGHTTKLADGKVWETIAESTMCVEPIKVKKGDKLFMSADYDLDLHPSRAMGDSSGLVAAGAGGHSAGGHGKIKSLSNLRAAMDGGGGEAEQMALVVTYFAGTD